MKKLLVICSLFFAFSCSTPEKESVVEPTIGIVGKWESDVVFSVTQKPGNAVLNSTINSPAGSFIVFEADSRFSMTKFSIKQFGFDSFTAGVITGVYEVQGNKIKLTSTTGEVDYFTAKVTNVTELQLELTKELLLQGLEESKPSISAESYKTQYDFISVYASYKQEGTFTKR